MPIHDEGADLGDVRALQGTSAMHQACVRHSDECKDQCQMVQLLVDHGADVNAKDDMVCGACACSSHLTCMLCLSTLT